jgi:pimeloyl-ACP methyl ester carboxylesterase
MRKTLLILGMLCLAGLVLPGGPAFVYGGETNGEAGHLIRPEDLRFPRYGDNIMPVDYSDPGNWLAAGSGAERSADVFFLYPTSWRAARGEYPISAVDNAEMRQWADHYLKTCASAFATAGNIYAPYYRQFDASFIVAQQPKDDIAFFSGVPLSDVTAAFEYYLEHHNKGKPFILVGHSQGSFVLAAFLTTYMMERPDIYDRMIAAYLIGMPVPQELYDAYPRLKPARSADDLGVIITYNTNSPVVDGKDPFSYPKNVLINPISWVTDDTYAPAADSRGGIEVRGDGTLVDVPHLSDAKIDLETGTLVSNVDREKFSSEEASRAYFPLGVLHENDIPLYYYDLRANAENRTAKWFAANGRKAQHSGGTAKGPEKPDSKSK